MHTPNGRRWLLGVISTLPMLLSLAIASPALAATSTADVSITISGHPGSVKMGQQITYVATMTNHGPDDATFVDAVFSMPVQLHEVSVTCAKGISADGLFCEYSSLKAGETVVSTLVATAGPGTARRFSVWAKVNFENSCSFDPNCTFDPNMRNDSASVTTRLLRH